MHIWLVEKLNPATRLQSFSVWQAAMGFLFFFWHSELVLTDRPVFWHRHRGQLCILSIFLNVNVENSHYFTTFFLKIFIFYCGKVDFIPCRPWTSHHKAFKNFCLALWKFLEDVIFGMNTPYMLFFVKHLALLTPQELNRWWLLFWPTLITSTTYQICNLILLPPSSIVFILKSIPTIWNKKQEWQNVNCNNPHDSNNISCQ